MDTLRPLEPTVSELPCAAGPVVTDHQSPPATGGQDHRLQQSDNRSSVRTAVPRVLAPVSPRQPSVIGLIIAPILQIKKLKHRD